MSHPIDFPGFEPHPLLRNRYLMTAACALPRAGTRALTADGERRIFRVDGSTSVAVDLDHPREGPRAALVVVHGMMGSSASSYVLGTAQKAVRRGFLVARINVRNCGNTEALTDTVYNGGITEDASAVAAELARDGNERVHLIGFSLGGNMVLKLAAEWGSSPPTWAASVAAVSPSIDLARSAEALESGLFQRFLQRGFVAEFVQILRKRHQLDGGSFSLDGVERLRTLRELDDRYTAPLSGYRDADEYYRLASAAPLLPRIELPTLIVTARDDPLVPFESFREPTITANPRITLLAPERGGHVGFVAHRAARNGEWEDRGRFWAENRAVQFASGHEPR